MGYKHTHTPRRASSLSVSLLIDIFFSRLLRLTAVVRERQKARRVLGWFTDRRDFLSLPSVWYHVGSLR